MYNGVYGVVYAVVQHGLARFGQFLIKYQRCTIGVRRRWGQGVCSVQGRCTPWYTVRVYSSRRDRP